MDKDQRKARARALLSDDLLVEVIDGIEAQCISEFRHSAFDNDEARRAARMKLWAIGAVITDLKNIRDAK